jgi:hypothetical protein
MPTIRAASTAGSAPRYPYGLLLFMTLSSVSVLLIGFPMGVTLEGRGLLNKPAF